jgi:hypothetical protein
VRSCLKARARRPMRMSLFSYLLPLVETEPMESGKIGS